MAELYERDFKGVWIPKEIWSDGNLSMLEKVIAVEIDSLDQGERGCFASNKYFAEFCGCSESAVSKAISKLIEYGVIYVQKFDGRQRELKSRLAITANLPSKICEAESENLRHINTSNNPPTNKKSYKRSADRFTPPTLEDVKAYCLERNNNIDAEKFIDYYSANGWVQGSKGKPIRDWKACIRTWEKNSFGNNPQSKKQIVPEYMIAEQPKEKKKRW